MMRLPGRGAAAPKPDRFELTMACAATDREFTATFARAPGGLYRVEETVPLVRSGGLRARALALLRGSGPQLRVGVEEIAGFPDPCPGCGLWGGYYCLCGCGAFVCAARLRGDRFTCRDSCGVSFRTQPLHALDARRGGGPAPADPGGPPRLPNPSVKLLPRR